MVTTFLITPCLIIYETEIMIATVALAVVVSEAVIVRVISLLRFAEAD